ncbi:MAG: PH domain-containing protein [Candidatus Methanoplasma sp.]|nr:PH domain-containing protein [Candidatus Methanoplasma sp.]
MGWVFWAHLILILVVILPLMAVLMILGSPGGLLIPILLILLVVVIVSMLVVYKTMYIMDDEKITVQGVFKKREIPYGTVTKIINTDKGLPSGEGILVLSPDRIVILYGENVKVSLSPLDKPDALGALRSYCPNAEYEEDLKAEKASAETEADVPENGEVPDTEEDTTNSEEEEQEETSE